MNDGGIEGKVVLVTGGTRGIGRAIVQGLLAEGARVALTYRKNREIADALVAAAGSDNAMTLEADASDFARARAVVAEVVERWGAIDGLVNNAGIARDVLFLMSDENAWDEVIGTNLKGAFNYCRAVIFRMMKQGRGSIVNVASVAGFRANPGQSAYAASKAAVIQLTRALAREVGLRGVRVNCVAPGVVETEMTAGLIQKHSARIREAAALGRWGQPEDVTPAVLFLLSDGAKYVTGHTLVIDGGLSL